MGGKILEVFVAEGEGRWRMDDEGACIGDWRGGYTL